jgi:acyl carrier protein|tara:strand:- start:24 stop:269 length:246 start_codon:yes stop_codon:yes gene_type:complete
MQQAEIIDRVNKVLQQQLDMPEGNIKQESHILNDLGADSLDSVEILLCMEEEFGIEMSDDHIDNINNVKDIVKVVGDLLER